MPEDRWVEPRARIPLAGIVAMVLIVAVVAVFLKTQLSTIFPATTIQFTDGASENVAGRASASFEGLREIALVRKERLTGLLHRIDGALVFTVDVPERLLTISRGATVEDVLLEPGEDGTLTAAFEHDGTATRVDVDTLARAMIFSKPGVTSNPITVPLTETLTYEGYFTYRSERLLYQYRPGERAVRMLGSTADTVPLTEADGDLRGVWSRDGTEHLTMIDLDTLRATIAGVW